MKVYTYNGAISYGAVCGVVVAENLESAKRLIDKSVYSRHLRELDEDLEIKELKLTEESITDFSWKE